jgi:hypothetical protein
MKKFLYIGLVLLLVVSTSLVTAIPALACTLGSLLSVSASASEVSPGGSVTLYIAEQNTTDAPEGILENVYIDLSDGSTTTSLNNTSPWFVASSDTDSDGVLDYLETWRWEVTLTVNTSTTFMATGHGINWSNNIPTDITFPAYPERFQVTVFVTPLTTLTTEYREVGGEIYPVNKVGLLTPWIASTVIIIIGTGTLIWRRKTIN